MDEQTLTSLKVIFMSCKGWNFMEINIQHILELPKIFSVLYEPKPFESWKIGKVGDGK
jgi:hypothetical protein